MRTQTKLSLSPARRKLLELLQWMNYGCLENLLIRCGEPSFDPPPLIVRDHKFQGENGPRPERGLVDYQLKPQVLELFDHFDQQQRGTIQVLEVKHGLPFRMVLREPFDFGSW